MTPSEVKTYIINDPALAALAGAPGIGNNYPNAKDQTICDVANLRMVSSAKKVSVSAVFLYLIKVKKWRVIRGLGSGSAVTAAADAAFAAVELVSINPLLEIDLNDPVGEELLSALVSANLITADNKAVMQAMSTVQVPDTQARFGRPIQNLDVARAFGRVGFGA